MDPRDFVRLASRLALANPTSAAQCRTAIGRVYYGAFHHAVQALNGMGAPPGEGSSAHGKAPLLLLRSGDDLVCAAGGILGDLHTLRGRADYKLTHPNGVESRHEAIQAASDADKIIATIDNLLSDPVRWAAVRLSIRASYQQIMSKAPPP